MAAVEAAANARAPGDYTPKPKLSLEPDQRADAALRAILDHLLATLRANVDYGTARALTTYGVIGVKCWVFKGDVTDKDLRTGALSERAGDQAAR